MSKRFLGIICLLYTFILSYVTFFDKLKNYLAPQLQIYIKISIVPMLIISLVLLFNDKINHKFKYSDLILLLPLLLLITSGDGRLTISFANNRTTNFKIEKKETSSTDQTNTTTKKDITKEEINNNSNKEELKQQEIVNSYDFSKVDINVIDANYGELANYITFEKKAEKYSGKTIRFSGFALDQSSYLDKGYYAIGKYIITCCAADAEFGGFIVKYDKEIIPGKWYEVEGILEKLDNDAGAMAVNVINIKEISSANQEEYVYPCYVYDGGLCEALANYNFEY